MAFTEIADRVWVARYEQYDVNVTLVGGSSELLVVDTHGSAEAAREVIADVRALGVGEVTGIVNTHAHFDHVLGNRQFVSTYGELPIVAHEAAVEELREADLEEAVLPTRAFSSAITLDLGDRAVELVYPGRGHTSGDLVVRVPDADVLLAGDLVEESAAPAFGADSWPMDWPLSLDIVLGLTGGSSVVLPGHGAPVNRDFVEEQRNAIGIVAETIRDLAGRGVPVGEALAAGEWPFPREGLEHAVRRGYEQLPNSQKRLPLL